MFKQIGGTLGSIVASLCCLGFAPLLAALSAAGLGFAINDAVLIPLLAAFLGLALWGLRDSRARHGNGWPLRIGAGGAIAALAGVFVFIPLHVAGLLAVVGATVWDMALMRRHGRNCSGGRPGKSI